MPKAICEDCGSLVDAELTHNGVCPVGHYVHCGWGHQLSPEDLIPDDLIPAGVTDHIQAQAAEIEWLRFDLKRAVKAGVDVAASLSAAISLLQRGGKKAAPSDKMFNQMLADYNASLDRLRTTFAELTGGKDE